MHIAVVASPEMTLLNPEPRTLNPSTQHAAANRQRTLAQRLGYDCLRVLARLAGVWLFGLRALGRENWPAEGGALVCANHQSLFDPPLVGLTSPRRLNYLARDTLFRVPGFQQFIAFFDAIPIDREGGGLAGLKETLRRLKGGEMVLIFPEGTRTCDGEIAPLKPGFIAIARRSRVPLVPVGLDGAFQAWPRTSPLPRLGRIAVVVGPAITPAQIAALSDDQLLAELLCRMRSCHATARDLRLNSRTSASPDCLNRT